MLQEMNIKELETVDGGGTLKDIYTDIRDFINNNLGDLIRGIKDGWNSK